LPNEVSACLRGDGCRCQSHHIRFRGYCALQRHLLAWPRKLMACFLPVRPWRSPDLRVLSHVGRLVQWLNRSPSFASRALQRHLSVLPLSLPPPYRRLMPTMSRPRKAPRSSYRALQHFRISWPFSSLSRLTQRPIGVALPTGSPALRVWLPSRRS
jgi:hypothetical protein